MSDNLYNLDPQHLTDGRRVTFVGILVNAVLSAGKLAAGIVGHSQALIADAVHSVSDLVTDVIVLVGLQFGQKPPDESHHFGHGRIETLASALVGVALLSAALVIGYQSVMDIYTRHTSAPTGIALVVAGLSVVSKEWLYRYTVAVGRRIGSSVVIANAWHHRSDALSSVAVFAGIVGTWISPSWVMLDSLAAILVAALILKVGLEVLWVAVREVADTAPDPQVVAKMRLTIDAVEGVVGQHDLRVRTTGGLYIVQVHIEVDGLLTVFEGHAIADEVSRQLRCSVDPKMDVTVHVDPVSLEAANP